MLPPGNKMGSGPLTPVDSPRREIEKIIQNTSPGGGVAKSQSGLILDGEGH